MHQLSRIAFDVPVLTAAQNGRRSALSSPKVATRALGSASMSPTIQAAAGVVIARGSASGRSEEHTSELQSLMRISSAVFCLKKKKSFASTRLIHMNNYR